MAHTGSTFSNPKYYYWLCAYTCRISRVQLYKTYTQTYCHMIFPNTASLRVTLVHFDTLFHIGMLIFGEMRRERPFTMMDALNGRRFGFQETIYGYQMFGLKQSTVLEIVLNDDICNSIKHKLERQETMLMWQIQHLKKIWLGNLFHMIEITELLANIY